MSTYFELPLYARKIKSSNKYDNSFYSNQNTTQKAILHTKLKEKLLAVIIS